jgi:hypothetical protein
MDDGRNGGPERERLEVVGVNPHTLPPQRIAAGNDGMDFPADLFAD